MIPIKDRNPSETFPVVTIAIIVTNVIMFIFQLSHGRLDFEQYTLSLAATPKLYMANPFSLTQQIPIFTSMFLHAGLLHIAGNMLFLWIFGDNVEDYFGHFKFALFYLACGYGASLTHILTHPGSQVPIIGASGAISGVLGAYFLLFPKARVLTILPIFFFFYFIEVPAYFFLGVYIVLQLLYGLPSLAGKGPEQAQSIAWFAHIGGFFTGIILLFLLSKRRGFRRR